MFHENEANDVRFTPDGRHLVTAGADRTLRVWDSATGRQISRVTTPDNAVLLAVPPSADWTSAATLAKSTRIWDLATGVALTERLPMAQNASRAAVDTQGHWLAIWQPAAETYLFPVPRPAPGPVPNWLPGVGEATAGPRFGAMGEIQVIPPREAIALASRLRQEIEPDPLWATILRRFLGEEPKPSVAEVPRPGSAAASLRAAALGGAERRGPQTGHFMT